MKVWIDGAVVDGPEARLPVTDHGLLFGDGVFEGMRMVGRRVFQLDAHMRRLRVSARSIGLALPGGVERLRAITCETARAFPEPDAYLRLLVTRGDGGLGVDPTLCDAPRVVCIAVSARIYPAEVLERGLHAVTASVRRPPADVLDPRAKTLNYLNSVLAKGEARRAGADEALILNQAGLVAEASVANVFACRDGVLTTPPATDGALEGITRAAVLALAPDLGLETRVASLGRFDLLAADEVFLTGTGARVVPVCRVDGQPVGEGKPGAVTARVAAAYEAHVAASGCPVD